MPPIRSLTIMLMLLGCAPPPLPETAPERAASAPYPALLPLSDLLSASGTAPVSENATADDLAARAAALRARADALR